MNEINMIKDKIKRIKYLRLSKVDKQILKIKDGSDYHFIDLSSKKPISERDAFYITYNNDEFYVFKNLILSHSIPHINLYNLLYALNILTDDKR